MNISHINISFYFHNPTFRYFKFCKPSPQISFKLFFIRFFNMNKFQKFYKSPGYWPRTFIKQLEGCLLVLPVRSWIARVLLQQFI